MNLKQKITRQFYKLIAFTKHFVIPGFKGMSVYDVALFFGESLSKGSITTRASSLAFNFFLALFPGIIFLFALIPYVPIDGFQDELFILLRDVFPPTTFDAAHSTINDIVNNKQVGLLSLGFLIALYFSTNGINSLIEAFNATIHTKESRTILQQRWVSLVLTLVMALLIICAIILIIFSQNFIEYLENKKLLSNFAAQVILDFKWITLLIVLYAGVSFLYYYGPSKSIKLSLFSPGSLIATLLIVMTSLGFSYYIDNFAQYNKLYGSIGTLIIILLWLYFNSIIFLIGFELNTSIIQAIKVKNKTIR
ncbi:MAG: YihY/virulence factor BrkB family protein [Flavobacteriales bacterium]